MTEWWERGDPIAVETVLHEWVEREARKDEYPDADPAGWERERLRRALTDSYEEPADPVGEERLDWRAIKLTGAELGELGPFPGSGWEWLSAGGSIADAVTRLDDPAVAAECPDAAEQVAWVAEHADREFGSAVALEREGEWPPVLLDGNHRACGLHRASRAGATVDAHRPPRRRIATGGGTHWIDSVLRRAPELQPNGKEIEGSEKAPRQEDQSELAGSRVGHDEDRHGGHPQPEAA